MTPRRRAPGDPALAEVLDLLHRAFAYMEGRIDPPSSLLRLTPDDLERQAADGEIWTVGDPVRACVFLTPKPDRLYLAKLAVDAGQRGRGLARVLTDHAASRARALGLPAVELQSRVELTEVHDTFRHLGFAETGRKAHEGYLRPTSITFRRPVDP